MIVINIIFYLIILFIIILLFAPILIPLKKELFIFSAILFLGYYFPNIACIISLFVLTLINLKKRSKLKWVSENFVKF